MLVQMPHRFFAAEASKLGFGLPEPGEYAAGLMFLPRDPEVRSKIESLIASVVAAEGQVLLALARRAASIRPGLARASSRPNP